MDPVTLQIAVAAPLWLWHFIKKDIEGFSSKLGEKLGERFVDAIETLITQTRASAPPKALDGDISSRRELIGAVVNRVASSDPATVRAAAEVWGALHSLLNDPDCISVSDLEKLIAELGAPLSDWKIAGSTARHHLVGHFVDSLRADPDRGRKLEKVFERLNPNAL